MSPAPRLPYSSRSSRASPLHAAPRRSSRWWPCDRYRFWSPLAIPEARRTFQQFGDLSLCRRELTFIGRIGNPDDPNSVILPSDGSSQRVPCASVKVHVRREDVGARPRP